MKPNLVSADTKYIDLETWFDLGEDGLINEITNLVNQRMEKQITEEVTRRIVTIFTHGANIEAALRWMDAEKTRLSFVVNFSTDCPAGFSAEWSFEQMLTEHIIDNTTDFEIYDRTKSAVINSLSTVARSANK